MNGKAEPNTKGKDVHAFVYTTSSGLLLPEVMVMKSVQAAAQMPMKSIAIMADGAALIFT